MNGDFFIFALAQTFSAVLWVLIARWYVWPWLREQPLERGVTALLWPHAFRFINLAAATQSQVDPAGPRAWLQEVAWGDFAAAVLALLALLAVRSKISG